MSILHVAQTFDSKPRTVDVITSKNVSFDSFLLSDKVLNGLKASGFQKPSPIQLKAIPVGRCGFDLIVKAKSGTGKTLVFSVIGLEMINTANPNLQALILVPTREIAVQIQSVFKSIGQNFEGLKVESFIGGLSIEADKEKCKLCHIAVGTPGRLKYLITSRELKVDSVRLFVLDEADKLMEKSFESDINEIYNSLPSRKQMITTSATYPNNLNNFLSNYMMSPTHVSSELETPLLLGLKQFVHVLQANKNVIQQVKIKNAVLVDLLTKISFTQCLIFSNYQTRAESVCNYLNQKGWQSMFIAGTQSQTERLRVYNSLIDFKCRIILSTDIAARGIDAANVDVVINYDIPKCPMTYLHRMGRAGRFGSHGLCINLAFEGSELEKLRELLGLISGGKFTIPKLPELDKCKDLVNQDDSSFEYITALMPENASDINTVQNEILQMKQSKKVVSKPVESTSEKVLESEVPNNEVDVLAEKLSSVDTKSLLESMASGVLPQEIPMEEEPQAVADISVINLPSSADEYRNRKRPNESESAACVPEKQKPDDIFCKNKALFSVSKLLVSGDATKEDDIESIQEYLQALKSEEQTMEIQEEDTSKILKNIENYLPQIDEYCEEPISDSADTLFKDIVKIAYECAISKVNIRWRDVVIPPKLKKFRELTKYKIDEALEEEMDDSIEEIEDISNEPRDTTYDFLKWVPVKKPKKVDTVQPITYFFNKVATGDEEDYEMNVLTEDGNAQEEIVSPESPEECFNEGVAEESNSSTNDMKNEISRIINDETNTNYTACYNQCSETLWQNACWFDSVEAFDTWFYNDWQSQVRSVSDYVQRNVFIEEMNKYRERVAKKRRKN